MTPTGEDMECFSCRNTSAAELPIRERILRTPHWRVAHAFGTAAPGWLVVLPVRHVSALADLDAAAEQQVPDDEIERRCGGRWSLPGSALP